MEESITPPQFVFVDENNVSPGYRAVARQAIRSHVTKNVARQFRKKQKLGQKKNAIAIEDPLIPQTTDSSSLNHSQYLAMIDDKLLALQSSLRATDIHDETSIVYELQKDFEPGSNNGASRRYSPIVQRYQVNSGRMIPTKDLYNHSSGLSPLGFLGAGRIDPFLSYPVENPNRILHELIDINVTYFLPGMAPDDYTNPGDNSVNSVAKAWVSASIQSPFLFHAMLFMASIHYDYLRSSKIDAHAPLPLSHKVVVIRKLSDYLSDGRDTAKDEVILTILLLAAHENIGTVPEETMKPFNTPLETSQWLNIYGNNAFVPEHMKAVLDLIASRGGIENLKLHGQAENLAIVDIVGALNAGLKPVHPPLHIHGTYIAILKEWATNSFHMPIQTLATGFWKLFDYGITATMTQILDSLGYLTMAIKYYIQGKPAGLTLGQIIRTRTAIQSRLLALPTGLELNDKSGPGPNLYECCRLTAIIYSIAVTFPMPSTYQLLQSLVQQLKTAIEDSGVDIHYAGFSGVILWILVLGGISAMDKPERPWFVSQLALVAERLDLDWSSVEAILRTFLWLESACTFSGTLLWKEVVSLDV